MWSDLTRREILLVCSILGLVKSVYLGSGCSAFGKLSGPKRSHLVPILNTAEAIVFPKPLVDLVNLCVVTRPEVHARRRVELGCMLFDESFFDYV